MQVRIVPKNQVFVYGKAGVIEALDGTKTCFPGSINETKNAFAANYEILWEDSSAEGVKWVEDEFAALWKDSFPLPDAIIEEIKRVAERVEVGFREVDQGELPASCAGRNPHLSRRRTTSSVAAFFRDHFSEASADLWKGAAATGR